MTGDELDKVEEEKEEELEALNRGARSGNILYELTQTSYLTPTFGPSLLIIIIY